MIFNLITKIVSGISLVLLITCLVFYSLLLGKTNTINTQKNTISLLEIDNKVLKDRVEVCQSLCLAEKSARELQQAQIDSLRGSETTLLEKLTKLKSQENENKDVFDRGVSPERSRLLNNHCERIRGSPCSDP